MVHLARGQQPVEQGRCPVLELVDADAGVQQQGLATGPRGIDERERRVRPSRQGAAGIEAGPAQGRVEIEAGQVSSRA